MWPAYSKCNRKLSRTNLLTILFQMIWGGEPQLIDRSFEAPESRLGCTDQHPIGSHILIGSLQELVT